MAKKTKQASDDRPVQNYKKILVGFDGSENSRRALAAAALLASDIGASLRLVVAMHSIYADYGSPEAVLPETLMERASADANKLLEQGIESCTGVKDIAGVVQEGHPGSVILEVAEKQGADLIVVGRRGLSGVERFLMGGVSSSVVNHSTCDVLVVK